MTSCIGRRDFITLLGGGATVVWPLAARAQQRSVPMIGFLSGASAWEYARVVAAFREGMKEAGYVEGRDVTVEYRWAEGHYERLSALTEDLLSHQVAGHCCERSRCLGRPIRGHIDAHCLRDRC